MGMLKSIGLKNYKCFKDDTTIDIAPLTVLCGVNSSGKSSILKSLLMLKQTTDNSAASGSVVFSGELTNGGTFKDIVCNSKQTSNEEFTIKNRFEIRNHKLVSTGTFIRRQDAKDFNELRRMFCSIHGDVEKFIFDVELVIKVDENITNEFSKFMSSNIIKNYNVNICVKMLNDLDSTHNGYVKFENRELEAEASIEGKNYPHYLSWSNIPGFYKALNKFDNYRCQCDFNGLSISNIFDYNMNSRVKSVVPNILAITRIVSNQYKAILHIAPLRHTPERTYLIQKNVNNVGVNGEYTPILLAKLENQCVVTDMFCPYTNELEIDDKGYVKSTYYEIIQQWLDYFEMGKLNVLGSDSGTITLKLGDHNITDIGFGMSQVLPIIVQGIFMDKDQTLLVEQPEIHLHPKMELQMADFLIALAETDRNIIIETHSEYIKDRIVYRVLSDDTRKLQHLININFLIQDKANYSTITKIELNDENGICTHPKEFFDQGATEQLKIMQAGVLKRRKLREGIISI